VPPRSFAFFGFADPTPAFARVTVGPDGAGRALVDGVLVIPGLPVCRVRLKTDAAQVAPHAPRRAALVAAVHLALREDALAELPLN
jgi:hypothetical protein